MKLRVYYGNAREAIGQFGNKLEDKTNPGVGPIHLNTHLSKIHKEQIRVPICILQELYKSRNKDGALLRLAFEWRSRNSEIMITINLDKNIIKSGTINISNYLRKVRKGNEAMKHLHICIEV